MKDLAKLELCGLTPRTRRRRVPSGYAPWMPHPEAALKKAPTGIRAAGFDHHLIKPVDPAVLSDLMGRAIPGAP